MTVGIGIAGAGTIGGALVRRLIDERAAVVAKTGLDLEVRAVAVGDLAKPRPFTVPDGVMTDRPLDLIDDPRIDLIVELIGGTGIAGDLVMGALRAGKPVVTANKELVAARGPALWAAAEAAGADLLFEAAVGGGIPIIRPLSETLAGERIVRVLGIVNGTTNYILSRMADDGATYADALAAAQGLGYAEPDPTADVSGADATSKATILAGLAFGAWIDSAAVHREGIEGIRRADIGFAADLGYVIKLLAVAERTADGVSVRVHPAMVPVRHPLASIRGATNAVFIEGGAVGELLLAGPGAGRGPTTTAVLGDVIDAARGVLAHARVTPRIKIEPADAADFGSIATKWYIRLEVEDRPGVLAAIAAAFGDHGVSIKSVRQEGRGDRATVLVVTHRAPEARQRAAVAAIAGLDVVAEVGAVFRVESDEA
ncbi:MAG: homoserine dehydrogenase [Actinobacteria bacterium]|jgi:homoserine dehydrogenase|nr:homoserine dehydrogenase [Actinomycetota bacterium]MBU1493813.1 homoserine dehydrogenase [Actinomycetota bacterium]